MTPREALQAYDQVRDFDPAGVGSGSKATFPSMEKYVCFTPNFGHSSAWSTCLFRAKTGLMHRSK